MLISGFYDRKSDSQQKESLPFQCCGYIRLYKRKLFCARIIINRIHLMRVNVSVASTVNHIASDNGGQKALENPGCSGDKYLGFLCVILSRSIRFKV